MKLTKHLFDKTSSSTHRFFRVQSGFLVALLAIWVSVISGAQTVALPKGVESGVDGVSLTDSNLKVEQIDTHPDEFFLSHDMDLSGSLVLGGREGLFVYERTADGGFQPRQEIYRFPADTWVYDVETYGDDLLVLTNTALYRLPGAVEKRADIKADKILWGNPLGHHHQGLHGIEFAPNGDLLICMGDPHPGVHLDKTRPDHLWLWTWYVGPEKRKVPYAGVGAVMRLNLDSYDFSVYASGLRNPCGISFDRDWNLFSNDNDQEGSTASPGRLLSVPQHSWSGWARGWDATRNPARRDMIPSANRTLDVPVGQGYYDHTSFGKDYQGSLFVANWGGRNVTSYPLHADGAGFQSKAKPLLQVAGDRRPVSAMPTNEGNLIVSVCYMMGNEPSPKSQTDLLLISPRKQQATSTFKYSDKSMVDLLSESIQIRAKAHREILRQGGDLLAEAGDAFGKTTPDSPAFSSLVFLAAAHGDDDSIERIISLAQGEGRAASLAWRAAATYPDKFPSLSDEMINAAAAKRDDAKLQVGLLEFLHAAKRVIPASVAVLAAHEDPFVRQSAAILLARQAPNDQLAALADGSPDQRLAATLATVFKVWQRAETVTQLPVSGTVAVEKMMKLLHPEGPIDLSDLGAPIGTFRMSDWWRDAEVKKANQVEFDRLLNALADDDKTVANTAATGLFFLKDDRADAKAIAVLGNSETALSMAAGQANKADLKKALLALKGAKLSTGTEIPEAFRKIDWDAATAPKGDAAKGKELFTQRGCVACHLAPDTGAGGAIGPTLVDVGSRFPPSYLAASILVPNLTVSPNFHPNTVTMNDGAVHTGFVEPGAEAGMINLRGITGATTELVKSHIAKQEASEQSMMPASLVQKPEEMADLIAYMMVKPKKRNLKKGKDKKKAVKKPAAVLK
ncbi:c-type cytochrome [Verrucomicrobiales bacterium]|nr:c-type cytochrome [Verrucomicrobiales bacterium]